MFSVIFTPELRCETISWRLQKQISYFKHINKLISSHRNGIISLFQSNTDRKCYPISYCTGYFRGLCSSQLKHNSTHLSSAYREDRALSVKGAVMMNCSNDCKAFSSVVTLAMKKRYFVSQSKEIVLRWLARNWLLICIICAAQGLRNSLPIAIPCHIKYLLF